MLKAGEGECFDAYARAVAIHGDTHPVIRECMADLLKIAKGADPGYRGRYIGDRLRAIFRILDMLAGRPREAPEPGKRDAGALDRFMDRVDAGEFEPEDSDGDGV